MPLFRRRQPPEEPHVPTTAERHADRQAAWTAQFPGPSAREDYRRLFTRYAPVGWDIMESTQGDLLRLLIGRVPADIGVPALFGLTALFSDHAKPEDVTRATLSMIVIEMAPAHARLLLVALADAWQNHERKPYDKRSEAIENEVERTLRRLSTTQARESGVVDAILDQIEYSREWRAENRET